jgi:hypothetical protein
MEVLQAAMTQLGLLGGVAAIIAVLINIFKTLGVIQDGQATTYSVVANFVVFAGLVATNLFKINVDVAGLDANLATYAVMLTTVFGYFVQLGGTKLFNSLIKGVPVIGKSYTADKAK